MLGTEVLVLRCLAAKVLTARASFGTDSQEWWPFPTSNDLTFKNLKELPFIFKKERNQYGFFFNWVIQLSTDLI